MTSVAAVLWKNSTANLLQHLSTYKWGGEIKSILLHFALPVEDRLCCCCVAAERLSSNFGEF